MNASNNRPQVALVALVLAAVQSLLAPHASAAGYKNAEKTGASIAEFRDEIVGIRKSVDATMVALNKIVTTADSDPRKAFKEFDASLPKIDSAVSKTKKRAEDMKAKGQAYFQQWEKDLGSVNDADIRKLAEERKVKLQATFSSIQETMDPAKERFNAWLGNLKDLQNYLSNDLTIGGIDAAKELISKSQSDGRKVQESLDKVIAELNTIVATITPAKAKK